MFTQHIPQGRVQQMGGGVVTGGRRATGMIDHGIHCLTRFKGALGDLADMQMMLTFFTGIANLETATLPTQSSSITDLPARLGIKRGLFKHDDGFVARFGSSFLAIDEHPADDFTAIDMVVAREKRFALERKAGIVINAELAG